MEEYSTDEEEEEEQSAKNDIVTVDAVAWDLKVFTEPIKKQSWLIQKECQKWVMSWSHSFCLPSQLKHKWTLNFEASQGFKMLKVILCCLYCNLHIFFVCGLIVNFLISCVAVQADLGSIFVVEHVENGHLYYLRWNDLSLLQYLYLLLLLLLLLLGVGIVVVENI